MKRKAVVWGVVLAATASLAGCNGITGADKIVLLEEDDSQASGPSTNGATSGAGAGDTVSTGAGADDTVSTGAGADDTVSTGAGAGMPTPEAMVYADGVQVTDIDLYQAIRRPLMESGSSTNSDIPIVAGKDATVRVFYSTAGDYNGQPVTARLTVGEETVEQTETLSGSSSHQQLNSTINLQVPGSVLAAGASYKLELLQPGDTTSGNNSGAAFPSDGSSTQMGIEQGGVKLKIVLVPVQNNGTLPDTSATQVQRYLTQFKEEYPVADVEVTVRSQPYTFNGYLGNYNGWANLLDDITSLRNSDGVSADTYYYGIHDANGNGLLGLGWVGGPNDVWARNAIGVGWTGETATETAVHELGHNHGREHSPCGVSGDPAYPHSGASVGVWGFSPSKNTLFNPSTHKDFMSYCHPQWISDWTFKALFNRLKHVSTSPDIYVPSHLKNRTYDRIRIIDGQISWRSPVELQTPPIGEAIDVEISTGRNGKETVLGHYYPYNHITGGVLYVMRPGHWMATLDRIQKLKVFAEGQNFNLGTQPLQHQ